MSTASTRSEDSFQKRNRHGAESAAVLHEAPSPATVARAQRMQMAYGGVSSLSSGVPVFPKGDAVTRAAIDADNQSRQPIRWGRVGWWVAGVTTVVAVGYSATLGEVPAVGVAARPSDPDLTQSLNEDAYHAVSETDAYDKPLDRQFAPYNNGEASFVYGKSEVGLPFLSTRRSDDVSSINFKGNAAQLYVTDNKIDLGKVNEIGVPESGEQIGTWGSVFQTSTGKAIGAYFDGTREIDAARVFDNFEAAKTFAIIGPRVARRGPSDGSLAG